MTSNPISAANPCEGKKAPPGHYLDVSKYDGFCKQIRLGFINGEQNGKQYEIPAKYCKKSPKCVVPISAAMFIERAEWVTQASGRTLKVFPTLFARLSATNSEAANAGWDELYAKYKDQGLTNNLDSMKQQYVCHQVIVATPIIGAPYKSSWNLDEWRPFVSLPVLIKTACNP